MYDRRVVGGFRLAVGFLLIVVACWAPGAVGQASTGAPTPQAKLERIVNGLVNAGAPGALAVVRTTTTIDRAAAGLATVKPRSRIRASDRYRIASVTKTFVATVVLQLAAEGRLSLADPVERWLPGLVPNGQSIPLRQLLNHTSGIFDFDEDPKWVAARFAQPGREWSPGELVGIATSHPPRFPPGKGWSYSNTNYVLLGLVVQAVTGRPLGRELEARLFKPLALGATSYPMGTRLTGRYAHGYFVGRPPLPVPAGTLVDVSMRLSPSAWGAGQMVSNANDITAFFAALLKGRLVRPTLLKAMKSPVPGNAYGLGLVVARTACGAAFGHDGDIPGYRNVVWASPNGRRVAAIMINIDSKVSWGKLRAAAEAAFCTG
jgi:D-alanyl-D-alanine carboxypeptidase